MTIKSDERVREAYNSLPYTQTRSEEMVQTIGDLRKDNQKLQISLGEAVSQIQQLQAQLDYLRGLNANLDNRG